MNRRKFLGNGILGASGLLAGTSIFQNAHALNNKIESGRPLVIPDVIEPGTGASGELQAIQSTHEFISGIQTSTLGYNQAYLGPVIRFKRGMNAQMQIKNQTQGLITAHWHGLHVNGAVDGGPQTAFGPGKTWSPELNIDQPASTLWYHSHVHGITADQVYAGLAGMIIIDDPDAKDSGLPSHYGVDDIPLIIQDRAFTDDGQLLYIKRGPLLMHGFRAGEILVNGAIRPKASVPKGLVRLRLLNASNARIYNFSFDDGRSFYRVGSDGGLLPKPITTSNVELAPAERAEIIVDFSNTKSVRLLSSPDSNSPMGSMMGNMISRMTGGSINSPEAVLGDKFEIMQFTVDASKTTAVSTLPEAINGAPIAPEWEEPSITREFRLDMHVSSGGGMGNMQGGGHAMGIMGINNQSMDPEVINFEAKKGSVEHWRINASEMAHPFHVHGTSFQVLKNNGVVQDYSDVGLKDVVLVKGEAEILVHHRKNATEETPFMYHCHILEHEDAGMMGQFTVV